MIMIGRCMSSIDENLQSGILTLKMVIIIFLIDDDQFSRKVQRQDPASR